MWLYPKLIVLNHFNGHRSVKVTQDKFQKRSKTWTSSIPWAHLLWNFCSQMPALANTVLFIRLIILLYMVFGFVIIRCVKLLSLNISVSNGALLGDTVCRSTCVYSKYLVDLSLHENWLISDYDLNKLYSTILWSEMG